MISFPFTTNKSFLNTGNHPITIPKEVWLKLRYQGILSETDAKGDKKQAKVVDPKGKSAVGFIYRGTAGYGPYYQVKLPCAAIPLDFCFGLEIGERINVEIKKVEGYIDVNLNDGGTKNNY